MLFTCNVTSSEYNSHLRYYSLYDANDQFLVDESYMVSDYFFDSSLLTEPGFIDNSIRRLTKQVPLSINPEYSGQLTNMLFK